MEVAGTEFFVKSHASAHTRARIGRSQRTAGNMTTSGAFAQSYANPNGNPNNPVVVTYVALRLHEQRLYQVRNTYRCMEDTEHYQW